MLKLKLIATTLLAILLVVVIAQNTEAVDTRLLFVTITMPRALLLVVALLIGFVLGLLTSSVLAMRTKKPA